MSLRYTTIAGDQKMDDFFRRLKANGVRVVDGNSVVRDLVARGEVKVGLTDTDDVNVAIEDGQPIAMVLPDQAGLGVPVMPNMVSLIANGPRPDEGRKLIDYLLSPMWNGCWRNPRLFRFRCTAVCPDRRTSRPSTRSSR